MCLARKVLDTEDYERWRVAYESALNITSGERKATMEALASELETGMELLGATAIEDKL